jgi:hypothetical protein
MKQQGVIKPAVGHKRPLTWRVDLAGRTFDLDLTHKPNLELAIALGYLFPVDLPHR